jgi:putative hydrolase of the HAD superfamily
MLNDIQGAASAGFKTALFAGDRRSLRLRENDPRVQTRPDAVLLRLDDAARLL